MIHTTNPIYAKIWLQFTRIEEYWLSFFCGRRSALKGRIQSNPKINHDESYLNWITIKSRTHGNRDELKIFLKNCLIASRFNQELNLERKNIGIYKKKPTENSGPFDLKQIGWTATIACMRCPMIPRRGPMIAFSFTCPILIGPSRCLHASPHDRRWCDSMSSVRCYLNSELSTCAIDDLMDQGPLD